MEDSNEIIDLENIEEKITVLEEHLQNLKIEII